MTDGVVLAFTKLRTHKIRTVVTILVASLLFGVLTAASLVVNGGFESLDNFRSDGLTSRYIVNVNNVINVNSLQSITRNNELIAQAKKAYTQLVEKKTNEAKRLGISYSQASDQPPYMTTSDGEGDMLVISDVNGITQQVLADKYKNDRFFDDAQLKTLSSSYGAIDTFSSESYTIRRGSSLEVFADGKEKFYDSSDATVVNANYVTPLINTNFSVVPSELTTPFMLPNNAGWTANSGDLPIILPQNIIERLLGLEKLSDKASSTEKLERLTTVKQRASSLTFQACYRNKASINLIQQAIQQQNEMATHVNDKDYQKPSLIYALPDSTKCGEPYVISDTRTKSEKKQAENQELFDQEFNSTGEPSSYFVTFKVVGISPATSTQNNSISSGTAENAKNVSDIINNLLATNGIDQAIPKILYDRISDKTQYADLFTYTPLYLFGNEDNKIRYVEFASASDAQKFIDEQSCTTQYDNTCKPLGRPYMASLSFSNSAAIDDLRTKSSQLFKIIMLGVMALATIIMWITVSRTISDSRHESAVFRAIGFKRIDIALIYVVYAILLSVCVLMLAGIIGLAGAYIANILFSPQLTAQAQYSFGGIDLSKTVSLIGFNWYQLLLIAGGCLATGFISVMPPLLRNVRRNPVRDMRTE